MKTCTTIVFRVHLFAIAVLFAVSHAHAQNGTWNVDADGLWGTDTNWLSNTIASGSGNTANFTNDITANRTVNLDSDRTLTNVVFGDSDTATAGSWTLGNNGTATNNLILAGTTPTITVSALGTGRNATISAIIEGSAGLTKEGTGTLILSGVNTYSGTTTVNAGTLSWGVTNALAAGNLTVNSGGTVNMQTFTDTVGTITLNAGGTIINGGATGNSLKTGSGGFITTGGNVTTYPGIGLGGNFAYNTNAGAETTSNHLSIDFNNGSRTFTVANGVQSIDVDVSISLYSGTAGNLNFIKAGPGTMRIGSGNNNGNFNLGTGTTTIQDGVLLANKATGFETLGGSGLITVGDGSGTAGSAILRYTSGNDQFINNALTILSDGLFDLNGRSEITSGALTHSSGGSITTGAGTLSLGAATNTISGASTVIGNLTFSNASGTSLTIGGTANMNGTTTFSGSAGAGITSTGTPVIQGTLALGTANRAIAVTSGNLTVSAQITGNTGTTTKSGTGTLILAGNNTYTGGITASGGTLEVQGSVANSSGITNNAALIFNSGSAQSYGNVMSGTGTLTKAGAGTLTLSGSNGYTGTTTISAGTLSAGSIVVSSNVSNLGNATSAVTLGSAGAQGTLSYTGNNTTYTRGFTIGGAGGGRLDVTTSGQTLTVGTGAVTGSGLFTVGGAGNTTISADLTHTGGLTKEGLGTLSLSGAGNTFSGDTTVNAGTLSIGSNTLTGAVNVNGGTLALGGNSDTVGAVTITSGSISSTTGVLTGTSYDVQSGSASAILGGSGVVLTKSTGGTVTLTGVNSYSGATNVNAGTLIVGGAGSINSSSAINVAAGARFANNSSVALTLAPTLSGNGTSSRAVYGGTGTLNAALTLDNVGDVLSPGNSPGIQSYGVNQSWASNSYDWEVNDWTASVAGTNIDQIQITGNLTLTGNATGSYILNVLSLTLGNATGDVGNFSDVSNSWNILTTTTGISGFNASFWTINTGNFTSSPAATGSWNITQVGNNLVLNYVAVPEPATIAMLGSALGLLGLHVARRRKA